jgi:adenosylcobinamide kinase/adenosylcobinamide-phosphate guanylyltransferase
MRTNRGIGRWNDTQRLVEEALNDITLVIGGCRSGKSAQALALAEGMANEGRVFIATCVPHDEEMQERVARHRRERSASWTTVEAPVHLANAVIEHSAAARVLLVDCLTLWVSNLMGLSEDVQALRGHIAELVRALSCSRCPVVLVTNEVGCGIVPENSLARLFRDVVGWANQAVAGSADRVIWTVAGIPVTIKGGPERRETS